jgi:hypothetical protein
LEPRGVTTMFMGYSPDHASGVHHIPNAVESISNIHFDEEDWEMLRVCIDDYLEDTAKIGSELHSLLWCKLDCFLIYP